MFDMEWVKNRLGPKMWEESQKRGFWKYCWDQARHQRNEGGIRKWRKIVEDQDDRLLKTDDFQRNVDF